MSRPPGLPKTGGRKPGTPNRNQLTEDMRKSIVSVFKRMGGTKWLLDWAKENETEFVRLVLSRVMPAPPRDDPAVIVNTGTQIAIDADTLSDREAALRIAFALAQAQQLVEPQGRTIEGATVPATPAKQVPPKPPVPKPPPPPPAPPAATPASEQREVVHFGTGREQGTRRRNLL